MPDDLPDLTPEPRKKSVYVGAPACFLLEQAASQINEAFGGLNLFLVGSALERPDWRDIDLRLILDDDEFEKLFPNAVLTHWEHDVRWLLLTTSISLWLKQMTGLPIDFQIQPMTEANKRHSGKRNCIGMKIQKEQP